MKKRFLMMVLAGVLAFSMIGCGGNDAPAEDPNTGDEIVDAEGDATEGDAVEGETEQEEQQEPEVQKPVEQKPEVKEPEQKDPIVDEPVVDEEETTGDAEDEEVGEEEGGYVIDKPFAEMSLEEMIWASYANIELPFTGEMEIDKNDADSVAFFLGTSDVTFKRAVVSEAMISSIAHSVAVLELEDGADAAAVAATLKETAPVGKWVCVVPEKVGTAHRGNIVMMVMSAAADEILANFSALQ